ncbi:uncharacterized protein BDR25DRAFT_291041 [Lindgomyces ingoldianus]|uniref:Uncharacterized protein n=1 Tax=Lindgomyces ingoldianus TaxID=673940 RepID=A0ACB6QNW3_9PLEO|nr:uncharacterized protein BDR25DRAFT_291041 [Lindgomyces ingoldianus]KAF2468263.1 hypothetical protein BDR25DRAFT_291041 [Lindgomyces ingoldianus]
MAEVVAPTGQAQHQHSPRQPQHQQQQQQQQQQEQQQQQQEQQHHQHHQHQLDTPSLPHGKKRAAENGLENEQRLSKRFDLLNLVDSNGTRLYIPVPGSSSAASLHTPSPSSKPSPKPVAPVTQKKHHRKPRPSPPDDCMQVEDTPHRVYIHDLAAELSDIESDEENPIFLSDIEKHLAKIPKHVLTGPEPRPTRDNQLVLYSVPSSLTVPEKQDNVRKAIVEARARVREKQVNTVEEPDRVNNANSVTVGNVGNEKPVQEDMFVEAEDPDAMDIDDY